MNLLKLGGITTALAATPGPSVLFNGTPREIAIQANFTYGSGGTSVDAYVQSSIDNGVTWFDIANFHFTTSSAIRQFNLCSSTPQTTQKTPTSGSLAANTCIDGIMGQTFRTLYVTTGTYGGTTNLSIDIATDTTQT
jgi:hypothetical protein